MEEEFYAAIKLVSGEEILSLVSASEEEDRTLLILDGPVIVQPIVSKTGDLGGYKVEPWMSLPDDSMYIIDMSKVITMTEISDEQLISIYHKYHKNTSRVSIDRNMGFISKVDDARKHLENLYKSS